MPTLPDAGEKLPPSATTPDRNPDGSEADAVRRLNEIGQLAAGVGHNVINAFSAVVSHAELLRIASESGRPMELGSIAEVIIRVAMDASGVARRLIDYSRTATVIDPDAIALDALADEVIGEYRDSGRFPEVTWVVQAQSVPAVFGNEVQLRAMFDHLIQNALEALPESGGEIAVGVGLDDRGWITIDVKDNGSGMPASVAERAVEPFFTTKAGRQGVGLTIAHGIWRRHHGTLAVRSQPGGGTVIRLGILPRPANDGDRRCLQS